MSSDWKKYNQNTNNAINDYVTATTDASESGLFNTDYPKKMQDRTNKLANASWGYFTDKQGAHSVKRDNQIRFQEKQLELLKKEAEKRKELTKFYDKDFNDNFGLTQQINRNIMDKERMIAINDAYYRSKSRTVYILTSFVVNFILFAVVMFIYFSGNIRSGNIVIYAGIFFFVSWITTIIYKYRFSEESKINKIAELSKGTLKGMERAAAINLLPKYMLTKCPAKCKPKEEKAPETGSVLPDVMREMRTDSTANVWSEGSKGSSTTKPPLGEFSSPGNWYDGVTNPTRYNCKWNGAEEGLLDKSKRQFNTTIPCANFPGYIQIDSQ